MDHSRDKRITDAFQLYSTRMQNDIIDLSTEEATQMVFA